MSNKTKILLIISLAVVLISVGLVTLMDVNPYAVFLMATILLGLILTRALSLP